MKHMIICSSLMPKA